MTNKAPLLKLDFKEKLAPKHLEECNDPQPAKQLSPNRGKLKFGDKEYEMFKKNHFSLKHDYYSMKAKRHSLAEIKSFQHVSVFKREIII